MPYFFAIGGGEDSSPRTARAIAFQAMPHDPLSWYPWYWQRWQRSRRVLALSLASRGLYRELLDDCWRVGYIPDSVERIAELVLRPVGEVAAAWPSVRPFFGQRPDGNLYHDGLTEIRKEQLARYDRLRKNGQKGGRPKRAAETKKEPRKNLEKSIRLEESNTPPRRLNGGGRGFEKLGDVLSTPPTPEQLAEFAAVKAALKASP